MEVSSNGGGACFDHAAPEWQEPEGIGGMPREADLPGATGRDSPFGDAIAEEVRNRLAEAGFDFGTRADEAIGNFGGNDRTGGFGETSFPRFPDAIDMSAFRDAGNPGDPSSSSASSSSSADSTDGGVSVDFDSDFDSSMSSNVDRSVTMDGDAGFVRQMNADDLMQRGGFWA